MTSTPDPVREHVLWIAKDFSRILREATPDELHALTSGTRWNNRQLLFHMVLGQEIARIFLILIGGFSRLPPGASRSWSRLLGACTGPYNSVNWAGAVIGGTIIKPELMQQMMDTATRSIIRWYDRADAQDLARGMFVPPSWDPHFRPWMNRRDLLVWAPEHYRHHRNQLTLAVVDQDRRS